LYPEEIATIKEHMTKFDCIQQNIIDFIRGNRLHKGGVENKQCITGEHHMKIGETAYTLFNEKLFGLKSVYCSDLKCFLDNLDESSVRKYMELIKKEKEITKRGKEILDHLSDVKNIIDYKTGEDDFD